MRMSLSLPLLCAALATSAAQAQVQAPAGGINRVEGLGGAPIQTVDGTPATGGFAGNAYPGNNGWVNQPTWYGQADGATLAEHVALAAGGYAGRSASANSIWYVNVLPGSSGLALGTPVTLTLSFKVDGTVSGGMAPGYAGPSYLLTPASFSTSAYMVAEARLAVADASGPPVDYPLAAFEATASAGADITACANAPDRCDGADGRPTAYEATHQATQWTVNSRDAANQLTSWIDTGSSRDVARLTIGATETLPFDSGMLSVNFQGYVGETLEFSASALLYLTCYSGGFGTDTGQHGVECAGWGDLSHTMQGSLSSTVTGLAFDGLSGAALAAPVPEPAAWALMALGLAGIAARRGRR